MLTSTRGRAGWACGSVGSTARSCSRWSTTASPDASAGRAWGCAWRRSRRFRAAAWSSSASASPAPGRFAWWSHMTAEAPRSPERLTVLVVDDHDVVHWGFRLMLSQQPWVDRCLSAQTGPDALKLVRRYRPHVALGDL